MAAQPDDITRAQGRVASQHFTVFRHGGICGGAEHNGLARSAAEEVTVLGKDVGGVKADVILRTVGVPANANERGGEQIDDKVLRRQHVSSGC